MSSPKSAAVKDIDIDILESEISVNIDICKGAIDPALRGCVSINRYSLLHVNDND